ncbi:hypothetical protein CBR_g30187 [Chara braunii]|uniref:Peroxisomal nicotinamide adenine dinucleotide carrier n=1 Tax=Chara braunii TaxID=69332 RepID=A0A388LCL3_CHABU|nr:hypothetical protein CBR_g30187 [Chara braunii]|eukprot:GBG79922.1 hypothetical protein CBR_g30187 [Chara braunii]
MSEAAVHGLAGAGGGIIAQLVTYPLQTVNTQQQVLRRAKNKGKARETEGGGGTVASDGEDAVAVRPGRESYGSVQLMYQLLREEGWGGLYKGLPPSLVGVAISQGVYYYFYQWLRSIAVQQASKKARKQEVEGRIGTVASLVVASLAGAINVLMTNPIWVIVTRMQTDSQAAKRQAQLTSVVTSAPTMNMSDSDAGGQKPALASSSQVSELPGRYGVLTPTGKLGLGSRQTAGGAIAELYREAGVLGFWKGVLPTLIMVVNPAIQFMLYEGLLARLLVRKKARNNREGMKRVTGSEIFVIGALAKLGATVVTYPMLVVKSRLQAKQDIGGDASMQYTGTLDAIVKMIRYEGVAGFYKGMSTKILQSVLAAAILFMTKEELVKLATAVLDKRGKRRQLKQNVPKKMAAAQ